ncbi:MAG: DUF1499 domain-containing protein [Stenotrophobium sp.]
MFKFSGKRPTNLGVRDGKLAACSRKPNCVSSQASAGDSHYVAPLNLSGEVKPAMQKLRKILEGMERVRIVESQPNYFYAEFSTKLMGYVDDVELYCDGKVIHVRSASRLGYSDMGVNRKRVEALRAAFGG